MKSSVQSAPSIDDGANLDANLDKARGVIDAAVATLGALREMVDWRLVLAAQLVAACEGRLVVSGVGKSGIAGRKIASTCASIGIPALFLHPTDAAHGDLGMMVEGDMLLCISASGESSELLSLVTYARRLAISSIAITANELSPLARLSDNILALPCTSEGSSMPMVPMASTVATIVLGDALATLASNLKAFSSHQLAILHPAGRIGKMLKPVQSIMHAGHRIPVVEPAAILSVIAGEMGDKGFGITAVVDPENDELLGVISDGDLRRNIEQAQELTAYELMTPNPQTLDANDSVDMAIEIVRNHRIGAILVTEATGNRLVGIVHVQDLLRLGLV